MASPWATLQWAADEVQARGSGINLDCVQDSTIVNNLIYDTHASGISLCQIDRGGPST